MKALPVKARLYLAFLWLAGTAVLFTAWRQQPLLAPALLVYLAGAVVSSTLKVRLPGITGTLSVNFVFVLTSIADLPLGQALMVGCAAALTQTLFRAKARPTPVQIAFNLANLTLAIAAGYDAFHLPWLAGSLPIRLLAAGAAFYITNTAVVALIIALTESKPFSQVWRSSFGWVLLHYLVGTALAAGMTISRRAFGWSSWLLILPTLYLLYRSYQIYLKSIGESVELVRAKTEAEEANHLKSEFLANMSHGNADSHERRSRDVGTVADHTPHPGAAGVRGSHPWVGIFALGRDQRHPGHLPNRSREAGAEFRAGRSATHRLRSSRSPQAEGGRSWPAP